MPVPLGRRGVRYTFASMDTAAGVGARVQFSSDQSLLVYFDQLKEQGRARARPQQSQITLQANEKVRRLLRLLESEPVAGVRNLHPAYCSLLVKFDALQFDHSELEVALRGYRDRLDQVWLSAAL